MAGKVLVTGAAGFIGSHLCEYLLEKGYFVWGIDNLITGKLKNIHHLASNNFLFLEQDICEEIKIPGRIDYIINLASPASPIHYTKHPLETLRVNSIGAMNVLQLAIDKDARILLASTSEVYGDPLEHPQVETYYGNVNSFGVRSCYDEGKRFMEAAAYTYKNTYGVNIAIARIFNTYGERMSIDDGRAIPAFFSQAIKGEPITIFGDGTQTRSFCYVKDTVEGLYKLLLSDCQTPVNIGNPEEITLNQLAKEVIEITGSSSWIGHFPLPSDDPKKRKPDISKAKQVLNWEPKTERIEGLKKAYNYFKTIL